MSPDFSSMGIDPELLAWVHPPDWENPAPRGRYHLVVIGGGTGGLVASAIAASLGARVALVERAAMGGDCLNTGCVPSKALIRAARSWHEVRTGGHRFGAPQAQADGSFEVALERMREVRRSIAPVDSAQRFRDLGVDVFLGQGRFAGPDLVEVEGRRLRFRRAIVATGAEPRLPSIPGLRESMPRTSETIFGLEKLPRDLVVLGGGAIAVELGQAMARFGARVTLVHDRDRLLPAFEPEVGPALEHQLRGEGVRIFARHRIGSVEGRSGEAVRLNGADPEGRPVSIEGEVLLVATGRAPRTTGLDLGAAGIEATGSGIRVDDHLRTTNRRVFAVGDVTGDLSLTHLADHMARIAVQNALFLGRKRRSALLVPQVVHSAPAVAQVGWTREGAAARGVPIEEIRVPLDEVDRARLEGEEAGFLLLLLRKGTDRIVGATLVSPSAGEIVSTLALAIHRRIGLGGLGSLVQPYPTEADILQRAVSVWRRGRLTPAIRRGFERWFQGWR